MFTSYQTSHQFQTGNIINDRLTRQATRENVFIKQAEKAISKIDLLATTFADHDPALLTMYANVLSHAGTCPLVYYVQRFYGKGN